MRGVNLARLTLWQRFVLAGAIVLLAGSLVIGQWVTMRITQQVTRNAAYASVLLVDSLITPLAQELGQKDVLSIGPVRALDEMMASRALKERIPSIKIWKLDGRIAYSTDFDLIGMRFPPSEALLRAGRGEVVTELDELQGAESANERALGRPMLEIYSPVRDQWTGEIIAVAEFYEDAAGLTAALREARFNSWLVVGGTVAAMALILSVIVRQGARTIERQRKLLEREIERVAAVSRQNTELRQKVERAHSLSTELNERYLRRVSADLHDGPAQLVGLASLRVGSLRDDDSRSSRATEAAHLRQVLGEAMTDIRNICTGLSLPNIEQQSVDEAIVEAVRAHERRTGRKVKTDVDTIPIPLPASIKICAYRFVQEGLNNALRHAPGSDLAVTCHADAATLVVRVENGPFDVQCTMEPQHGGRLGLMGLRGRVEALGGQFSFQTSPETGSRLEMSVRLEEVAA